MNKYITVHIEAEKIKECICIQVTVKKKGDKFISVKVLCYYQHKEEIHIPQDVHPIFYNIITGSKTKSKLILKPITEVAIVAAGRRNILLC